MTNKIFKLSIITASLLAANSASAAIYTIVPVNSNIDAKQTFSSAISDSSIESDNNPLGCFADTASCSGSDYLLGGDTRQGSDGISYRDEVPFRYDNRFYILDYDDLKSYCYNQLGYSTCDSWANQQWFGGQSSNDKNACDYNYQGGLCQERRAYENGRYTSNAKGFVDDGSFNSDNPPVDSTDAPSTEAIVADSANTVLNKFSSDDTIIGIASSGYYDVNGHYVLSYRQRGFYGDKVLLPKQDGEAIVKKMGRTFAFDSFEYNGSTYVVGSASIAAFDTDDGSKAYNGSLGHCKTDDNPSASWDCQNFAFATQAYIWNSADGTSGLAASGWSEQVKPNHKEASAQGSARTSVIAETSNSLYGDKPVLGGFNTYLDDDRLLMQAAIFYPVAGFDPTKENQWQTAFVKGAEIKQGSEYVYSNSLVKDINDHLIAIGETKRRGDHVENGAANNRLFYTDASKGSPTSPPTAVYLSGDIFFKGAGGEANAINNYNEVVGSIDAEDDREVNGKERRRRGFIDPLNLPGYNAERFAIFQGKSWWLDNLTNDDAATGNNNQYRIVNATGINDDGVISATANFCQGGYDNVSHNSYCGDGSGVEKLVAVKLIPIPGATSADIQIRKAGEQAVERSGGGSLGYFALTLLGLIGFRRRKNKM